MPAATGRFTGLGLASVVELLRVYLGLIQADYAPTRAHHSMYNGSAPLTVLPDVAMARHPNDVVAGPEGTAPAAHLDLLHRCIPRPVCHGRYVRVPGESYLVVYRVEHALAVSAGVHKPVNHIRHHRMDVRMHV